MEKKERLYSIVLKGAVIGILYAALRALPEPVSLAIAGTILALLAIAAAVRLIRKKMNAR